MTLQLDPAQTGHLHVGYQARRIVNPVRLKKLFCRRKRGSVVAERSQEAFRSFAHGFVVVYN